MHRFRTIAAGAAIVAIVGACQTAASPSVPSAVTSAVPSIGGSAAPSGPESGAPSGAPSGALNQLFPVFEAQGGSNLTGGGIVTDVEGGASVVLGVVAVGAAEALPVAIVEGDCATQSDQGPMPPEGYIPPPPPSVDPAASAEASPSPEASAAMSPSAEPSPSAMSEELPMWLTPIAVGSSNSVIPLSISDLTGAPHSIVIETSATDATLIACADLQPGSPAGSGGTGGAGASGSPEASGSPDAMGSPEASGSPAAS